MACLLSRLYDIIAYDIMSQENINLILSTIGVALAVGLSIVALAKFIRYISSVKPGSSPVESAIREKGNLEDEISRELETSSMTKEENQATLHTIRKVFFNS